MTDEKPHKSWTFSPRLAKLLSVLGIVIVTRPHYHFDFTCHAGLCRQLAVVPAGTQKHGIDAASFTSIRLISAAVALWLLVRLSSKSPSGGGNWPSAFALFAYAAGFSFAYINLTAATGALLLFGAVQTTMISYGMWRGERLLSLQWLGLVLALGGLVGLTLPGLSAPPLVSSLLMGGAGIAWGIYSLRGKGAGDPTVVTAGNFLRTVPITVVLSLLMMGISRGIAREFGTPSCPAQ